MAQRVKKLVSLSMSSFFLWEPRGERIIKANIAEMEEF